MVNRRRNTSRSSTDSDPAPDPPEPTAGAQEKTQQRQYQDIILGIIASLHLNPDYSDLKIICQDRVFPAHKLVLCPRSKYFQSACCGFFEGSITLDTRSSTLVEKMLEFLYTGDYTVKDNTAEVQISPSDSDKVPESDGRHSGEAERLSQTDQEAMEDLSAEEHVVGETAVSLSNKPTTSLMGQCSMNEKTPVGGEGPLTGTSEQVEAIGESLTDCHPCYFHLRMYGEADFFMIEDLKIKAEENFRDSFENCSEKLVLAQTIRELYSTRANYRDVRKLATKLIVESLRELQGGLTPGIDYDLLKAYPEFAAELCIATMEKYLSEPPSPRQHVPPSRVEYRPFEFKPFEYQWGK